ncbi:hypothetical protein [Mesorhizobium sp. CN2-181]|uniref:hypothetical protein n=1 Tax=Mesorhizobium yinganensis TaxID=3157707 RepID=UPI0032B8808C
MTAFLSVQFPKSVELLADSAAYDEDGNVVGFERTIRTAKQVPLAIAVRGASRFALLFADGLCRQADQHGIDVFLQAAAVVAERIEDEVRHEDQNFDLAIGAFSPTRGPCHFRVHTYPTLPGFPAFRLNEMDTFVAAGTMFDPQELVRLGIWPVRGNPSVWAKTRAGEIFDIMRVRKGEPLPDTIGAPRYCIGGTVELASITAEGVTVTRVRDYGDKVGSAIDPFAGAAAALLQPPTRQQRRAAEREARKPHNQNNRSFA